MSTKSAIKLIRFLERVWMIIGVTAFAIGTYETFTIGFGESYIFFIFTGVAAILYTLRRKQRTRMEQESENGE